MQVKMKENIDFTSDDTDQEMTHFDEKQHIFEGIHKIWMFILNHT